MLGGLMQGSGCAPGCAQIINVVQGQTASVTVQLLDCAPGGGPFSLAGLTGATGIFPNNDGTGLAASGVLVSADLGTLNFELDTEFTQSLNVGEQQTIQVQVDQGSQRSIAILQNVLTVCAPAYSPVNFGP